jgi:hypothetical protein
MRATKLAEKAEWHKRFSNAWALEQRPMTAEGLTWAKRFNRLIRPSLAPVREAREVINRGRPWRSPQNHLNPGYPAPYRDFLRIYAKEGIGLLAWKVLNILANTKNY